MERKRAPRNKQMLEPMYGIRIELKRIKQGSNPGHLAEGTENELE